MFARSCALGALANTINVGAMSQACEKRFDPTFQGNTVILSCKNWGGSPKNKAGIINWHPWDKYQQFCCSALRISENRPAVVK